MRLTTTRMDEERFSRTIRVLAKKYNIKLTPKDREVIRKVFEKNINFDCILGDNKVILIRGVN
jgi:transcription initiation factor TFIIIB Brf1 subunit/transcription initiation factor TFIIB